MEHTASEAVADAVAAPPAEMAGVTTESPSLFRGKLAFWLPILPMLALDLISKSWIFSHLQSTYTWHTRHNLGVPVWPEEAGSAAITFKLVEWYNTGTIWGLGRDFPYTLRSLRCLAIVVILGFVWKTSRRARLPLLALGVILAGALGNLYDNFTVAVQGKPQFDGGVRDFLFFTFWGYEFPAFNVADSCITCGAISLAIWLLFHDPGPGKASGTASGTATGTDKSG